MTNKNWKSKYRNQNKRYLRWRKDTRMAGAALYQILGQLLYETGRWDTDDAERILNTATWLAGNRGRTPPHDLEIVELSDLRVSYLTRVRDWFDDANSWLARRWA